VTPVEPKELDKVKPVEAPAVSAPPAAFLRVYGAAPHFNHDQGAFMRKAHGHHHKHHHLHHNQ